MTMNQLHQHKAVLSYLKTPVVTNNWRNQMTLDEFLKAKNIPGISELILVPLQKSFVSMVLSKRLLQMLVIRLSIYKINCELQCCQPITSNKYQLKLLTQHQVLEKILFWWTSDLNILFYVNFQNVNVM